MILGLRSPQLDLAIISSMSFSVTLLLYLYISFSCGCVVLSSHCLACFVVVSFSSLCCPAVVEARWFFKFVFLFPCPSFPWEKKGSFFQTFYKWDYAAVTDTFIWIYLFIVHIFARGANSFIVIFKTWICDLIPSLFCLCICLIRVKRKYKN